jgi:hypothetical protein
MVTLNHPHPSPNPSRKRLHAQHHLPHDTQVKQIGLPVPQRGKRLARLSSVEELGTHVESFRQVQPYPCGCKWMTLLRSLSTEAFLPLEEDATQSLDPALYLNSTK